MTTLTHQAPFLTRRAALGGAALGLTALASTAAAAADGTEAVSAAQAGVVAAKGVLGHRIVGAGDDKVIVLHEWLGDHTNWQPVWPYLQASRKRAFVFADLRGYGWSKTMGGVHDLAEAVSDVLKLADAVGARQFHLVGHSMSGMIAHRVALQAPDRVKGLLLISPVPPTAFKADANAMRSLALVIDDDAAARRAIASRGGTRYGNLWIDEKLKIARAAATPEAMSGYLKMFTTNTLPADVPKLGLPVAMLVGRHDLPFYQEASVRAENAAFYTAFDLTVAEEAGHYSMLETPVLVASQIARFSGALDSA